MRWLDWYGDGSLYVVDIALACCALEFEAAATGVPAAPVGLAPGARVAVVVSGTVTDICSRLQSLSTACFSVGKRMITRAGRQLFPIVRQSTTTSIYANGNKAAELNKGNLRVIEDLI